MLRNYEYSWGMCRPGKRVQQDLSFDNPNHLQVKRLSIGSRYLSFWSINQRAITFAKTIYPKIVEFYNLVRFREDSASGRCHPEREARMYERTNLTVDGSWVPVEDKDGAIWWRDHVMSEHTRRGDGAVRVAPFCQGRCHRMSYTRDQFHFAWETEEWKG